MRKCRDISKIRAKELFRDGLEAAQTNLSMEANPYPVLSPEAPHWALGWIKGREG